MSALRFLASTAPAAGVTGGLFLLMVGLIRTDFAPQDTAELPEFELAPVVEDLETLRRVATVEPLAEVDVPPPPPALSVQTAEAPSVRIAALPGELPPFEAPVLKTTMGELVISDTDAQPLVRIPGQMPPGAERSGHCKVRFDVDPSGKPFNIQATFCTERIFERPTVRSVEKWKFKPKIQNGQPVSRSGVINQVTYRLVDERGDLIPE